MNAVIIDDEEAAIRVLTNLLTEFSPEIKIVATARNVPDGVLAINRNKPDVVFLDIEMPDYSGFELLEFFPQVDFEIIFITAYSQYALRAFEVSAIDYLLKPLQINKLEAALEKLRLKLEHNSMTDRLNTLKENLKEQIIRKIALPISDGLLFVKVDDITHLDAEGAYTKVFTINNAPLLVSKNLKFFEDILKPHSQFFRPHRSHLININFLVKYSRHEDLLILENNFKITIAKNKKEEFESLIEKMN